MTWPQITIAAGLLINTVFVLFAWVRFVRSTRHHLTLPPLGMAFRRSGWAVALIPITEAWVLHQGNFWA